MDIYQEEILEHYRHPHNHGRLADADIVRSESNPTCGDALTFSIKLAGETVADVAYEGEGCAISQAAASMLTDELRGMTLEQLKDLDKQYVVDLLGIELSPTRLKCALLSLQAVTAAAHDFTKKTR
jgi:nitrogen fixation NifU-like protein